MINASFADGLLQSMSSIAGTGSIIDNSAHLQLFPAHVSERMPGYKNSHVQAGSFSKASLSNNSGMNGTMRFNSNQFKLTN